TGPPDERGARPRARGARHRKAVETRRPSPPPEPYLMRQMPLGPGDEEPGIEGNAAIGVGVELHHPAVESACIELAVDRTIERVGEIDAPAVAADLDHLRPAGKLAVLRPGVAGAGDDAADPYLAGELGIERVGDVVLPQVA